MIARQSHRNAIQTAENARARSRRRLPSAVLPLAALGLFALTFLAVSPHAAAGFDDACNLGYIEVDDDYPSSTGPPACQYTTLVEVSLLALQPTDVVHIHNGSYVGLWNITVNGLSLIGDSMAGVRINGTGLTSAALVVRAWDTNLTNMTLRGSSYGLDVDLATQAATNRTTLTNVALQGSPSWACVCYGANTRVRGLWVYNQSYGFLSNARGLDLDGLYVNSTGAAAFRMYIFGTNASAINGTLVGPAASLGAYVDTGVNVTLENFLIENASYGVYLSYPGPGTTLRNITTRVTDYGVYLEDGYGLVNLTGLTVQTSSRNGVYLSYGNEVVNLTRSSISRTGAAGIEWDSGMGLNVTDTSIQNAGGDGLHYQGYGYPLNVRNLTVDNVAASGIYSVEILNVSDSSINRTHDGVFIIDYAWSTVLSNLTITNSSNRGVNLGYGNSDARVFNLTIINAATGVYGRSLTRATFADNRIRDVAGGAFDVEVQFSRFFGNTVSNASHGYDLNILSWTTSEFTYNEIPTTNTLDGKSIIYVLNQTGVAVNSTANSIWIFNSTNITIAGVNQTAGASGIFLYAVTNVTIKDSWVIGNVSVGVWITKASFVSLTNVTSLGWQWVDGIRLESTSNATLTNITEIQPTTSPNGLSLYTVTNITLTHSVFVNGSNCVYMSGFQGVTIREVGGSCVSDGIYAETGSDLNVSKFFLPQDLQYGLYLYSVSRLSFSDSIIVHALSYALFMDGGAFANVTNVSAVSDFWVVYLYSFNNVTFRNASWLSLYDWVEYAYLSPDFHSFNSTFASLGFGYAIYFDFGCYNALLIHNNFYGATLYDGYGYGTWHGGYPVGGNYYDWAAAGFADEKTGPGQNTIVGHDGIKDAPAYAIGGGKTDNYALMDAWPPKVALTGPLNGSLLLAGTLLNFSISNFFDNVTWTDSVTGNATRLVYPHDINTTGWADGWHNITIVAKNDQILAAAYAVPIVTVTFSFEFDSSAPAFVSTPALGTRYIAQGTRINITATEPHLNASHYTLDGTLVPRPLDWSIDTGGLAAGSHTLDLFANDTLNNTGVYNWTFFIDDAFPTLGLIAPIGDDYFLPGTQITYAAADELNLSRVSFAAVEQSNSWSYSADLVANASDWSVDTSLFADGCYDLQVFATDGAGHVTADAWPFCVDSSAPDLSAFVEFFVDEDVAFDFDGALVNDLDWNADFVWTFDDSVLLGPQVLTGAAASWTFQTPGAYQVHLAVTDRAGNFAQTNFTLWVYDVTNPSVDFSVPASWDEDRELVLDGSGSSDNDGYWDGGLNGTFDWTVTGASNFTLALSGQTALLNLTDPGWYNITLRVTDRTGNWRELEQPIRINDTHAPTVVIDGSTATRNEGSLINLNGSRSSDTDPASPVALTWTYHYGSQDVTVAGAVLSFRADIPGTYTFTLTGVDRSANEASQSVSIRINAVPAVANVPPSSIQAGNIFEWTVQVTDADTADTHTFALPGAPTGMVVSAAGVVTWPTTEGAYGIYNITLRVADPFASVDFSFILTVTRAISGSNAPPFFRSFPVQSGTPGAPYAYGVEVADPDVNDHLSVALVSGPAGMTIDSSNTVHWQIPANATDNTVYSVELALSDGLDQVWQNYTIRVRANDAQPGFISGIIPATLTLQAGQETTILLAGSATDADDAFDALTFFAVPSDGTLVSVRVGLTPTGQPAVFVKGLKAGTTVVTVRVADPSGLSRSMEVATTVTGAPAVSSAFSLPLVLALAGLIGAGVIGIVVMRRRKKGDEHAPLAGAPASPAAGPPARPSAPIAEEVQVEVVQVPVAAPAASSLAPTLPPAAVAVGAGVAAAAAARPAPAAEVHVAAVKPPKGATYVIEGLFVIYQDGRMIYSKTDIGQQQLGDPELVSSMFTAVTQFIKDSFSAEGELNKMGYGENTILIERGSNVYMAVITFGEPDKELQEAMQTSIEKMAYAYAGIIEAWDGQQNRFERIEQYVAPVFALTSGITRQDVLAATTTKDVKVLSQLEFFQGFVRLKVGIKNDTEAVITKVTLDIDYNEDVLRLQRIEPASYKTSGARVMLNVLNPGEKSSVAFYFDPQICTETNIDGIVRFRDYKGVLSSVTMKTRKAEVVCPLFFTKEHANTAMLKRLIETELQEKDSKVYAITKLPPYVKYKDIFDVCKAVVLSHDVHMVREFVSFNPFAGEAWFYGETKVKGYKIVIRAAVREDNSIEFFAASTVIKAVTGLLAEFNHTLVSMVVERYSDVKIEQLYDEAKKHEIQSKALVERLGESEAGAGETEQQR